MKAIIANVVLFVCLLGLASFSFAAGHYVATNTTQPEIRTIHFATNETREIPLVAIDGLGNGILSELTVEIGDGQGRVFLSINDVLSEIDTQRSELSAVKAVESYLNTSFAGNDIYFTLNSDASVISGPSAGSAMAVALTFAATKQPMNTQVAITGAITEEGWIKPVDGLLAKAIAAKEHGYTLFLVPKEEASYTFNGQSFEEAAGIEVVGVSSLAEAVQYFKL